MNSIQSQICLNNFETFEEKMNSLSRIVDIYNKELGYNNTSLHLYRIKVTDNQKFINQMRRENIICGIHYLALHTNRIYNNKLSECPESQKLSKMTVSLPMNENLTDGGIDYIISKIKEIL
jgi:dTDP-4-amino-4,6-dideoxygalactose transaminase